MRLSAVTNLGIGLIGAGARPAYFHPGDEVVVGVLRSARLG